ncbi:MAG: hypothetical protein ACP5N9_03975 [Candidatus Bilamarchaeum sp.]|jgi:serine/threonine protein phosphatase PrpC
MSYISASYGIDKGNCRAVRYQDTTTIGRKSVVAVNFPAVPQNRATCVRNWAVYKEDDPETELIKYPFIISGHSHGRKNGKNRDRVGIVTSEKFAALILADGFGNFGDNISTRVREFIATRLFEMQDRLVRNKDPSLVLEEAVSRIDMIDQKSGRNGASVTLAVVFPDGDMHYAMVGNCPAYIVSRDNALRLGKPERTRVVESESEQLFEPTQLDADVYMANDGNLITAIRQNTISRSDIDTGEWRLKRGERLLVLSSGLVRNLPIVIDERNGRVVDSSRIPAILKFANLGLIELSDQLANIQIGEDETRYSDGPRYTRNFDKDRSLVGIEFLGTSI